MKTAIAISPMMRNVLSVARIPPRSRDGKPDGEDRAEDCPDDPAHVPSMRPGPVAAACIACAWLRDRIGDQTTRQAITRLARALGTNLA
jgi:hypothetical protein